MADVVIFLNIIEKCICDRVKSRVFPSYKTSNKTDNIIPNTQ